MSIKEFITRAKISTAENLLKFSDFSYLDISLAMGFSSQSAFISVFKKLNGITPKQYREKYYMLNISSESETDIDDTENI
jgi:AraC-like DNA-binding protein